MIKLDFLGDFDSKGLLLVQVQSFALIGIVLMWMYLVNVLLGMHAGLMNFTSI